MVKKVVAKPISKTKTAKKSVKDEEVNSLVLRQSYIPIEADEQLRALVRTRGIRMNELICQIILDFISRITANSSPYEIQKTPEPEIEYYVQEIDDGEWLNLLMTDSETEAREFFKNIDRVQYNHKIRLVRASIEELTVEDDILIENKSQ